MQKLDLSEAKKRLRISDVWQLLGLPGEPRKTCRCPFHEDRHGSFSVFNDGLNWKCFAGCGSGDAVDFLQRARSLSRADACREFLRLASGGFASAPYHAIRVSEKAPVRTIHLPPATSGTVAQRHALAALRNISPEAVALAAERGLLFFGEWKGHSAWFVTDCSRHNAQARRMDGKPWSEIGNKKAFTLPGSLAAWTLGANKAKEFESIAFCEGGPDLLAAFHFICCEARELDCSAVTMLGASLDIHPNALPLFARKRIRIFGHVDTNGTGSRAVERWAEQLAHVGADVDAFKFAGLFKTEGSLIKDLNDCTSICADDFEANRDVWGMLP